MVDTSTTSPAVAPRFSLVTTSTTNTMANRHAAHGSNCDKHLSHSWNPLFLPLSVTPSSLRRTSVGDNTAVDLFEQAAALALYRDRRRPSQQLPRAPRTLPLSRTTRSSIVLYADSC